MSKYVIPFLCWLGVVILVTIAWDALWGFHRWNFLADFTAAMAGLAGWQVGKAIYARRQAKE